MTYNLTNVTNATSIADFMVEMNVVSNSWIFSTVLISLFIIIVIVIKQLNYDMGVAFLSASIATIFLGIILLIVEAISFGLLGIFISIGLFSLLFFILGGK